MTTFTIGKDNGDIAFVAECDGEVLRFSLGWGHGGLGPDKEKRSQYPTMAAFSAYGFGLYQSGDLHDGHTSVADLMHTFETVYLTLDDYKADRGIEFVEVIDACRAWASLPPVSEMSEEEFLGEVDNE